MQHDPTIKIYNDMRSALPTLPENVDQWPATAKAIHAFTARNGYPPMGYRYVLDKLQQDSDTWAKS